MKQPVIPNGTPSRHKDEYMFRLWGSGIVIQSIEGRERGKRVILYRVRFPICDEDVALGLTEEDATITLNDKQIEVVKEQNELSA